LNLEYFIAKRIFFRQKKNTTTSIVNLAVAGIALGLSIMILSIAIVTGFKKEIQNKVIGFGSHIIIENLGTNSSFEAAPISKNQVFYSQLPKINGIKHIQRFATKAGIIKTNDAIEGTILKGVDTDFDWSFFQKYLEEGNILKIDTSQRSNEILISRSIANILKIKLYDEINIYFIQEPPKVRKFKITGIYNTGLGEYDKMYLICDIKHIQRLSSWSSDKISGFEVLIDDFDKIDEMQNVVFSKAGNIFFDDGSKLNVKSIKETNPAIFEWLELTNMNVQIILILMTLVAGINMISGLLIIILERTNMIGILKALGANNFSIRKVFLYNSFFFIGKGFLWGNLIGVGLSLIQLSFNIIPLEPTTYYLTSVPINLNITHILILNLVSMLIVFLMMLLPAILISYIEPIKAIKFN
jgi:lipoprotein-releasing system permease protein